MFSLCRFWMSKSYMRFKSCSSRNWKSSIPRIDKRPRDITHLRTRLGNGILKIVPYHLEKPRALQVHCYINMRLPSTTCQSKTYLKTFQLCWYQRMVYRRWSNRIRLSCTSNGRASLLQMHALTQRMFRCTDPIPISESEMLAVFFKVLEKHRLALWAYTSSYGIKLKFGPAIPLFKWWQLVASRD